MTNELQDPRAGRQPGQAAGVDLGNGVLATLVITATRTVTTPNSSGSAANLLAANSSGRRYAVFVQNNDAASNLFLSWTGAATVGAGIKVPANGGTYTWKSGQDNTLGTAVTIAQLQNALSGIWDGTPAGTACVVIETTA